MADTRSLTTFRFVLTGILAFAGAGVMAFLYTTIPGLRSAAALRHPANIVSIGYGWILIVASIVFIPGRDGADEPAIKLGLRYAAILLYLGALAWFLLKSGVTDFLVQEGGIAADPQARSLPWIFLAGNVCVNLIVLYISSFATGFASAVSARERAILSPKRQIRADFERLRLAASGQVDPAILRRLDAVGESLRFMAPMQSQDSSNLDVQIHEAILEMLEAVPEPSGASASAHSLPGAFAASLGRLEGLVEARKRSV
jgi:hypothetical protein